jgi:hypothetical protein
MKRFNLVAMLVVAIVLGVASTAFAVRLHPLDRNSQATGNVSTTYDEQKSILVTDFGDFVVYEYEAYTSYSFTGLQGNTNYRLNGYNKDGTTVLGSLFTTLGDGTATADPHRTGYFQSSSRLQKQVYAAAYYLLWAVDEDGDPIPGLDPVLSSQ